MIQICRKDREKYFVFMTTDTGKTARQIINTYELRPEIEDDFRQMKVLKQRIERKIMAP